MRVQEQERLVDGFFPRPKLTAWIGQSSFLVTPVIPDIRESFRETNAGNMTYHYTRRMVRVFIGQMIIIASLIAFDEYFPAWVLKTMVAAAVLLPIVAYLTIVVQPPVYHAWQSALRELYHAGAACIAALWSCFSVKTVLRACRFVATLRTFPSTTDEWVALSLFPFKLYVLMALPFLWLSCSLTRWVEPRFANWRFTEVTLNISEGYVLCLGILLFGALGQALGSHRGRSTQTVLVFALGVVFFWMLRPWGLVG